jgi:hypothetical protein
MADDPREVRHKHTPPVGVAAQLARPEVVREDPTPIGAHPEAARAKVADLHAAEARITARVHEWVTKDEKQHDEIKGEVHELRSEFRNELTKTNDTLIGVAKETAKQSVSLATLVDEANLSRAKKVALELAREKAGIDITAHKAKKRVSFRWYVIRGLVGVVIAGVTLLVEQLFK